MNIAIILTCHNRREKTVACLESLKKAISYYCERYANEDGIFFEVFLTDDGCTDGTAEAVMSLFGSKHLHIIEGDGNLYWAGGMRKAWEEARNNHSLWDFYLLLNDDTILLTDCFDQLMETHEYALKHFGKAGVYSGICCDAENKTKTTYGGDVWVNRLTARSRRLAPIGTPLVCDMTNANILLVSKDVVDKIGIFYVGYQHAIADYDYSIQAKKHGFPVIVTSGFCGECPNDHGTQSDLAEKIIGMTLKDRKAYYSHPLHSNNDYKLFIRRNAPLRYPMVLLGRFLNMYFPRWYYKIIR